MGKKVEARPRYGMMALIIVVMLVFGFFQEYIKIATNHYLQVSAQIDSFDQLTEEERRQAFNEVARPMPNSKSNYEGFSFFHRVNRPLIGYSKWAGTFVFIALHMFSVILVVRYWLGNYQKTKSIVVLYVAVLILAAVGLAFGKTFGFQKEGYEFARKLLGALQSLVPLMVLLPGFYLLTKKTSV